MGTYRIVIDPPILNASFAAARIVRMRQSIGTDTAHLSGPVGSGDTPAAARGRGACLPGQPRLAVHWKDRKISTTRSSLNTVYLKSLVRVSRSTVGNARFC